MRRAGSIPNGAFIAKQLSEDPAAAVASLTYSKASLMVF
jgi:hypothetical protein